MAVQTPGLAEMLLQNREGEILLLPALPAEWSEGSVSGLCAKGGVKVDMSWKEGRLTDVKLRFTGDTAVALHCEDSALDEVGKRLLVWSGEGGRFRSGYSISAHRR